MADNTALLLYLSADGLLPGRGLNQASSSTNTDQLDPQLASFIMKGGVSMGSRRAETPVDGVAEQGCLYPQDLLPFLRRPLFLLVDSPNSVSFDVMRFLFLLFFFFSFQSRFLSFV